MEHELHHFDGWTPSTLAVHLMYENLMHDAIIFRPVFETLRTYSLDELEWHHLQMHVRKERELRAEGGEEHERALAILDDAPYTRPRRDT